MTKLIGLVLKLTATVIRLAWSIVSLNWYLTAAIGLAYTALQAL